MAEELYDVVEIQAAHYAFAALLADGGIYSFERNTVITLS